jgi:hypothetical protein
MINPVFEIPSRPVLAVLLLAGAAMASRVEAQPVTGEGTHHTIVLTPDGRIFQSLTADEQVLIKVIQDPAKTEFEFPDISKPVETVNKLTYTNLTICELEGDHATRRYVLRVADSGGLSRDLISGREESIEKKPLERAATMLQEFPLKIKNHVLHALLEQKMQAVADECLPPKNTVDNRFNSNVGFLLTKLAYTQQPGLRYTMG